MTTDMWLLQGLEFLPRGAEHSRISWKSEQVSPPSILPDEALYLYNKKYPLCSRFAAGVSGIAFT